MKMYVLFAMLNEKAFIIKIFCNKSLIESYCEGNLYLVKSVKAPESGKYLAEVHFASLCAQILLEASLDSLVIISAEMKVTHIYESIVQATGFARPQMIGNYFSDFFNELCIRERNS
jgi:hypothetical protein